MYIDQIPFEILHTFVMYIITISLRYEVQNNNQYETFKSLVSEETHFESCV